MYISVENSLRSQEKHKQIVSFLDWQDISKCQLAVSYIVFIQVDTFFCALLIFLLETQRE